MLEEPPAFARGNRRRRGRRGEGIRYEARVQEYLLELYPEEYVPGPWLEFQAIGEKKPRYCQPDGLLFQPKQGTLTVVEVKLQHTSDAWWQLRWLYLPVVAGAFPPDLWDYRLVEVTKWYDPATAFPEPVQLCASLGNAAPGRFGVHIWSP